MTAFTPRIHDAIDAAARVHARQRRKDPDRETPYAAHVFAVGYLLAAWDFPETVVIAGLLHDVLEDVPKHGDVVAGFGDDVWALVDWVSERKTDAAGAMVPWRARKQAYTVRLRRAPAEAKAISCADKIHNMQSLTLALERGADAWGALSRGREAQLMRLMALREALADGWEHPMLAQYDAALARLRDNDAWTRTDG